MSDKCAAALNIKGGHYACDLDSGHTGWAHQNQEQEAIWYGPEDVRADTLDSMAGTLAAVLWDFHERAVARYGEQVAQTLDREPSAADEFEHEPDDGHDHEWSGGHCQKCGASQFLGAG